MIYLEPTHALVTQMKVDLAKTFPTVQVRDSLLAEDFYAEIGEDMAPNRAQIVVMTPERCLALLSLDEGDFTAVRAVIFDECHLIHSKGSGQNRRSLDAMLAVLHLYQAAPHADWLLLSAMMANASDLAAWMQELTGRPCIALNLDWKPTRQARGCLAYDQEAVDALKARADTARQIALAIRDEVTDLEAAGISVIQVDEPALREGLPLRRADWAKHLRWSVDAFRLATAGVTDRTQIHTHMCYCEFIEAIAELDADVISIESSGQALF